MLALTHHVVVQVAALRVGFSYWYPHYAVLGDDIVIHGRDVAMEYHRIMTSLGVDMSPSKGLVSSTTFEFAKRVVHCHYGDFSPLGAGAILAALRKKDMIVGLVLDAVRKGTLVTPRIVDRVARLLGSSRSS